MRGSAGTRASGRSFKARQARIKTAPLASTAPRLGGLKLGSRIHLAQEMLRVLPPAGTDGWH
jgi:hypothetical protein